MKSEKKSLSEKGGMDGLFRNFKNILMDKNESIFQFCGRRKE